MGSDLKQKAKHHFKNNEIEQALKTCQQILAQNPNEAEIQCLLGQIFFKLKIFDQALQSFKVALSLDPENKDYYHYIGQTLYQLHLPLEAIIFLKKAWVLDPKSTVAYNQLVTVLKDQNSVDHALAHFKKTFEANKNNADIQAQYVDVYCQLADTYEQLNDLDKARQCVDIALSIAPQNNFAISIDAKILYRQKQYNESIDLLKKVEWNKLPSNLKANGYSVLGKCYDKLNKTSEAFEAFNSSNKVLLNDYFKTNPHFNYSQDYLTLWKRWFNKKNMATWTDFVPEDRQEPPIFLIGFPRSGTTLLDQILSSHSQLLVLEEKNILSQIYDIFTKPNANLDDLNTLTPFQLNDLRQSYFKAREELILQDSIHKIIDKHPLNIMRLGHIYRFFPDAKIIVALRDPRDVCLSCFMQTFELNDAMAQFLSLETTVQYYALVMDLLLHFKKVLPFKMHFVRYEDVVTDLKKELTPLLQYLGVEWEDSLYKYYKTAQQRDIATPSYEQVVQPLYQSSNQRWRRYEKQLEPILPALENFVKEFGYHS